MGIKLENKQDINGIQLNNYDFAMREDLELTNINVLNNSAQMDDIASDVNLLEVEVQSIASANSEAEAVDAREAYDGEIYETYGIANRQQFSKLYNETVDVTELLSPTWVSGYYNSFGGVVASSSWRNTIITVVSGETYIIKGLGKYGAPYVVMLKDSVSGDFTKYPTDVTATTTAYAEFRLVIPKNCVEMYVNSLYTAPTYIEKVVGARVEITNKQDVNLFNINRASRLTLTNANVMQTDLFPCISGEKYGFFVDNTQRFIWKVLYYNTDGIMTTDMGNVNAYATAPGDGWLQFNIQETAWEDGAFAEAFISQDFIDYVDYDKDVLPSTIKIDKTGTPNVMYLGDSIVDAESGWISYFKTAIKQKVVADVAVSGSTMRNTASTVMDGNPSIGSNNTIPNQVQKIINGSYATPDIVIFSGGTNDNITELKNEVDWFTEMESYFTELNGETGYTEKIDVDTIDLENIFGAIRWCVEKIRSLYPLAHIYLQSPIQSGLKTVDNMGKNYIVSFATAEIFKALSHRLSINFIDGRDCNIYGLDSSNFSTDLLHPNADVGAKKLGHYNARRVLINSNKL